MGILGINPITTIKKAGMSAFTSLLTPSPSKAYAEGRNPREYVTTRGILIAKSELEKSNPDLNAGYYFQFNPQTISDSKSTLYETRGYTGLAYNDYYWRGGGERTITFQLFLDNTPQSKTNMFRPTAYGSKLANELKQTKTSAVTTKETIIGGEMASIVRGMDSYYNRKESNKYGGLVLEGDAYSNTRIDERGILPEVEFLQSFLYPEPLLNEETPQFASGGVVTATQFRPPATVVFALGPLYLEGIVKEAPVQYTLFDKDLTPIRGTMDITLAVFEFENLSRIIKFDPIK